MVLPILPLPVVFSVHFRDVSASTVILAPRPVALIKATVREAKRALTVRVAGAPLTIVGRTVCVDYATLAVRYPSVQPALVSASIWDCLLYTSPSPRDLSTSRMPSSA